MIGEAFPRVLITGACRGIGRACAELFAARGASMVLADNDAAELGQFSQELGAVGRYCDVASEASVTIFAAAVLEEFPELDLVINAAGGGYERTLGMYRVSRALWPALRNSQDGGILLNIPPADEDASAEIFPYASSQHAFQRLSAALAAEARGSSVRVMIGCPYSWRISEVLPDLNAGPRAETCRVARPRMGISDGLAERIVALCDRPVRSTLSTPPRSAA